jgi:hypothetical protein
MPLALRMEAALLADCSKADGTTALDFLVLDEEFVDELEELAVLEEADVAGLLAVGCTG